ncbi:MAG: hypothetical protein PVG39_01415 [Desulfobacteraceae bacterium]|jgi:hypothetical protein
MNFKKLFEICGIIENDEVANVTLRYTWFESDVQVETHKRLYTKSPKLLKALIEQTIFIETVATSGGKAKNPEYSVIKLIESVLSSPEKPITWEEIKEILESDS